MGYPDILCLGLVVSLLPTVFCTVGYPVPRGLAVAPSHGVRVNLQGRYRKAFFGDCLSLFIILGYVTLT